MIKDSKEHLKLANETYFEHLKEAIKIICGSARSMGIEVKK